jgi:hypothetical protein
LGWCRLADIAALRQASGAREPRADGNIISILFVANMREVSMRQGFINVSTVARWMENKIHSRAMTKKFLTPFQSRS